MDTDSDSDVSDRPPVDLFVEEGELSDQDPDTTTDPDQTLSEDQTEKPYGLLDLVWVGHTSQI